MTDVRGNCWGVSVEEADLFFTPDFHDRPETIDPKTWSGFQQTVRVQRELTAKIRYCLDCPVRAECATLGWDEEDGIYGGLTATERRRIDQGEPVGPVAWRASAQVPSPRREQVVGLVREGRSIPEVSETLGMVPKLLHTHLRQYLSIAGS